MNARRRRALEAGLFLLVVALPLAFGVNLGASALEEWGTRTSGLTGRSGQRPT